MALLLLFSLGGFAQDATSKTFWPEMPILRVGWKLWQCQEEHATGDIVFKGGKKIEIESLILPATYVRRSGLRITVDPCVASGTLKGGGSIVMYLPAEAVVQGPGRSKIAVAMDVPTFVTLADGRKMSGWTHFPQCLAHPIGLGLRERRAESLYADTTLNFIK